MPPVRASIVVRGRVRAHVDGADVIIVCKTCRLIIERIADHADHRVTVYAAIVR